MNALKARLESRSFKDLDAKIFLNQEKLLRDVHNGSALKDIMTEYRNISLDVVSLAEIQSIMKAAEASDNIKEEVIDQMKVVLHHVDEQMKFVSHERRKQLNLGEFMERHHYLGAQTHRHYSSDLLRRQIESALGRGETQAESAAAIDGQLGGVRTHPGAQHFALGDPLEEGLFEASQGADVRGYASTTCDITDPASAAKTGTAAELSQEAVYRNAKRLTELSKDLEGMKNLYENNLLQEYTKEKTDQARIEIIIQEYTQARLKDCMLKEGFAVAMRSPNAQIYLKMLRERIMGELQLSEGATLEDFSWDRTAEGTGGDPEPLRLDPEARYNFQHLNNE